jgi:D-arabinan exo alpha-(1,3)/(1,5)-arabinofuranosidase (non-reducing end)
MRLALIFLLFSVLASAQEVVPGGGDPLDMARLKNYSSARATSSNRFVASNDDSKRIKPGETLVMADLKGAGMISHIWLTVADNEFGWPRLLRFRVYYDGHKTPSVDAPLGDFFGVGHGAERNLESLMIRDSSQGRARNSYWVMPYRKSCRITVTNEGHRLVPMFYYHVDYRKYASLPSDIAYFHAYYRQERPARKGHNYEFLSVHGSGHYVGTVLSVVQTQVSWFGEGDDLFYIDGATKPQILGTGSEDYFNDAWGLRDSSGPWTGTPIAEGERLGSRLTGYRWHVPDPIPFTKSIWAGIEHSGWTANPDGSVRSGFEERSDYFSSVAFWYQKGVNEELPEPPYGYDRLPFGNATQLVIQNAINDVTADKGKASVQKEVDWAKDLLYLAADGIGARINIPIDISEAGTYELVGLIAQAPDYGDYTALMDGEPMNVDPRKAATSEIPFPGPEIYYNYLPEVYVAKDRALGMVNLTRGRHTLSFVCTGKDPHSVGYNFGLNDVVLEKVPSLVEEVDQATTDEASVSANSSSAGPIYRGHPLSYYLAKLNSAPREQKASVLRAIGEFTSDGAPAIQRLDSFLSDDSTDVRAAAISSLAKIGADNPSGIPGLIKGLSDSDATIRGLSALALKSIGPNAAAATTQLAQSLSDPVESVRVAAGEALGAIGPAASAATPALAARLSDKNEGRLVSRTAMEALGRIGPHAQAALPALKEIAEKTGPESIAAQTIRLIEGKEVPTYY